MLSQLRAQLATGAPLPLLPPHAPNSHIYIRPSRRSSHACRVAVAEPQAVDVAASAGLNQEVREGDYESTLVKKQVRMARRACRAAQRPRRRPGQRPRAMPWG